MSWLQVTVTTDDTEAPRLESLLEGLGAVSVSFMDAEDEPVLEPDLGTTPLWSSTVVVALFEADTSPELIHRVLNDAGIASTHIATEVLEDRDWEREWMTHFKPMRFGQRLWVIPSWSEAPEPQAVCLHLDPGLAFGTGTHPTTALCLTWLDAQDLRHKRVIDYGCGSGILGIAAALLGASEVVGTDIDPQALEATLDNAARNQVAMTCHPTRGFDAEPADVVIANILANPLLELAPRLAALTRPGGDIALSGILNDQAEAILQRYREWFDMRLQDEHDGWVILTGKRVVGH